MDATLILPLLVQLFLAVECARITTYLGDAHVSEGDSFFVACVTEPHVSPDWHKDGLPLPSWGHFLFHEDITDGGAKVLNHDTTIVVSVFSERYIVEPGRLIIQDAKVSDAGTYTCLGSGGGGLSASVAAPIAIEPMPAYQKARVNKSFSILCNIDTQPPPRVTWFLGDAPLTPSDRFILSPGKNGVQNAKLTIRHVTLEDRNRYTCRAAHMHCSDRLASQVSTQLLVSILAITTNEEKIGQGVTIDPSEPFVLSCDSGKASVPVKWEKVGDGPIAEDDSRLKVLENKTTWSLTIEKPTTKDAGKYKCTGRFRRGRDRRLLTSCRPR
ncbi:hypothetical protein HPB50_001536 [Hyalomma asiaticum]|uniref:Uncharacterized protein n=1 Tax=Hyalomma asiaticum TaxID=266040 RepID=A0ACB7SNZ9_HYAAI|nr:hypothetical protein HPB50_001536 [Hyalomma asiaticum]